VVSVMNGKFSLDDPKMQTYVLEQPSRALIPNSKPVTLIARAVGGPIRR